MMMMLMIKFCDLPTRRASSALLLATSISSNAFVILGIRPLLFDFLIGYSIKCECRENHTYHQRNKEDKYWSPLSTLLEDQAHQALSPRF